jgi:putative ABC transport system substrate-binding protein
MKRVGVLESGGIETDQQAGVAVFREILRQLGWIEGRNVRLEVRWSGADPAKARKNAEELAALQTDVIMVTGAVGLQTLLQTTRSVPTVFNSIADPVGSGYIDSLARPGGNATGFILFDYALTAKWVDSRPIRCDPVRGAICWNGSDCDQHAWCPGDRAGHREICELPKWRSDLDGSALSVLHRDLVVGLAAKHKLPAVYHRRYFITGGGLMSYGSETEEQFRGAAQYVDRILKGEKPADLPVQAPTKYELVINRKTAQALGLTVPPSLLARADDVID